MSTVGTAPLLLCLVHLDVRYVESIDIQTLHLEHFMYQILVKIVDEQNSQKGKAEVAYLSITLSILEQIQDEFSRFSRPAPLTIRMPVLRLSSPANTTAEASEGDRLFVGQNILQIPLSFDQWQLSDSKGSLPCVL
jgi:hypothetical protein